MNEGEPLHLKTKPVPALVTLIGGLAVTVDVFIQQMDFRKSLIIIFAGFVVFLIAGEAVKVLLDHIELPNPDAESADGSMIEKGKSEGDENAEGEEEAGEGEVSSEEDAETPA